MLPNPAMVDMDTLVSLCKRRGFIFQSSEIYGGFNGFWDYGPVGVELRRRVKDAWWRDIVQWRENVVGLDSSIICHPQTWVASGHVEQFSDPMADCKKCKKRFRADELVEHKDEPASVHGKKVNLSGAACPECGGEMTDARQFNLMFQTYVGALQDESARAYLRPETCQSIFTEFKNVQTVSRLKVPFGIAQVGKAFRNEITPRNFIFRSREFEQMELEFFCRPEESKKWYEYWIDERLKWFYAVGVRKDNLRTRAHRKDELAHYAKGCTDIEFQMPFGWSELEGIADRSDYDLTQHQKFSGKDLMYFDEQTKERFVPAVVETSVGVDRTCLALLVDAYHEEEVRGEKRVVMRFHPSIAPFQAAVFPLSGKLAEPAMKVEKELRKHFVADYDDAGSIGRRYRRHDEIGTSFCVTYDFQSEEDHAVTIRDRDSMKQERVAVDQLISYLTSQLLTCA